MFARIRRLSLWKYHIGSISTVTLCTAVYVRKSSPNTDKQFSPSKSTKKNSINRLNTNKKSVVKYEKKPFIPFKEGDEYYSKMFNRKRKNSDKPPIRCLVIDGGGLRGCLTLQILKEIQQAARDQSGEDKRISDLFDYIMGTSTGGLLSLGLGIGNMTIEECEDFYDDVAIKVFNAPSKKDIYDPPKLSKISSSWNKIKDNAWYGWHSIQEIRQKEAARYSGDKLKECIRDKFGDDLMCDPNQTELNKPFVSVVAVRNNDPNRAIPMLLRNYIACKHGHCGFNLFRDGYRLPGISNIEIWKAGRATGAAPIYFESVKVDLTKLGGEHKLRLIDGGLTANTPALLAWVEATRLWPDRDIFIYSVGTGQPEVDFDKIKENTSGVLDIVQMSLGALFSGKESANMLVLGVLANMDRLDFMRHSPKIDAHKTSMDNWRLMKYWRDKGQQYAQKPKIKAKLSQMVHFLLKYENNDCLNHADRD